MIINEKGLVKALKSAYKRGGYTISNDGQNVALYTEGWYLRAAWDKFPRKALATIVEHMGTLPAAEALVIMDGYDPQVAIPEVVGDDIAKWIAGEPDKRAKIVPVTVGVLQLFQTEARECYGIKPLALGILERDVAEHAEAAVLGEGRLTWTCEGEAVVVEAFRPTAAYWATDGEKAVWAALEAVELNIGGE